MTTIISSRSSQTRPIPACKPTFHRPASSRPRPGTTGWPGRRTIRFLGALSRQIEALDPDGRQLVLELLDELPSTVGILSPRVLVPVMAKLTGVQLNLLAAEAVGTAVVLEAALRVVAASQPLESACEHFGIELVVTPAAG